MRVVVTGATGLIGRTLIGALRNRGDEVMALSRDEWRASGVLGTGVEVYTWARPTEDPAPEAALDGADAVVNLLGEPVAQRWTAESKAAIRSSRVAGTHNLVAGLLAVAPERRPTVLVSQSATGYYGPRDDQPVTEDSPAGTDFLAEVVVAWEREALQTPTAQAATVEGATVEGATVEGATVEGATVEGATVEGATAGGATGLRAVVTRTGVVLSPSGGALAKMLPFFRLGIGGPVAGGRQYVPWIHLDDVVGAMLFCLDNPQASGPVNLTAPNPATNAELSRTLGRVLKRPAVLPVPAFALQVLYGDMAEIVTTGQRALPARLEQLGYAFRYSELEAALRDVLGRG
jgi:NAD dependent epimerase/dehydratase family enzyme